MVVRKTKQTKQAIDKRIEGLREALLLYDAQQSKQEEHQLVNANIKLLREKEDLAHDCEILNKENIKIRDELEKANETIDSLREKLKEYDLLGEKPKKSES